LPHLKNACHILKYKGKINDTVIENMVNWHQSVSGNQQY